MVRVQDLIINILRQYATMIFDTPNKYFSFSGSVYPISSLNFVGKIKSLEVKELVI